MSDQYLQNVGNDPATPSFAAPNMSAVGNVTPTSGWHLGELAVQVGVGFTIEAWILPSSAYGAILANADQSFQFSMYNGVLSAAWQVGANFTTIMGQTQLGAAWTHVAVTFDGTSATLYVDGVPDAVVSLSGLPTYSTNFSVGGMGGTYACDIWSLTFYDFARDATTQGNAPWQDVVPVPGLVANFDFSVAPPQETTAALPITPNAGAVSQTLAPALRCDGAGGVLLSPAYSFATTPQFTVSAWVAVDALVADPQTVFAAVGVDPSSISDFVWIGFIGAKLVARQGGSSVIGADVSINPQEWHNVAMTCDGSTLTVYFDGQAVARGGAVALQAGSSPQWSIGFMEVGDPLTGWVQWLSVWSRALSPDEVVLQMYAEVGADTGIACDCALDVSPTEDLTGNMQLQFGGDAQLGQQRITVTQWAPPPEQLDPPTLDNVVRTTPRFAPTPRLGAAAPRVAPFSDAHLAMAIAELEPHLARFDAATSSLLRRRVEERTRAAFQAAREDPGSVRPTVEWRRDGDEAVFIHHDPEAGDVELLRVPADAITACQQWWLTFMFTLLAGILGLLFIRFKEEVLTEWLQRQVLNNQTLMEALQAAFSAQPGFTATVLLKMLSVLHAAGLLKSFLWFVAYQAGWWALGKALFYLIGKLLAGSAGTVLLFATQAALLVAQLALQIAGGPNVPGYSGSCGSETEPASTVPHAAL